MTYQDQLHVGKKGCGVCWIPTCTCTFYHHLETHHPSNKDWNICDTSRWSESGDSHLIMTSLCHMNVGQSYQFWLWGASLRTRLSVNSLLK